MRFVTLTNYIFIDTTMIVTKTVKIEVVKLEGQKETKKINTINILMIIFVSIDQLEYKYLVAKSYSAIVYCTHRGSGNCGNSIVETHP